MLCSKSSDGKKTSRVSKAAQRYFVSPCALSLTSTEMSSLVARLWLTAAREACSMSLMHLLIPSMEKSHSRWPGALSLKDRGSKLSVVGRTQALSCARTSVLHYLTTHKACGRRAMRTEVSFVLPMGFWYAYRLLCTLSYARTYRSSQWLDKKMCCLRRRMQIQPTQAGQTGPIMKVNMKTQQTPGKNIHISVGSAIDCLRKQFLKT